MPQMPTQPFHLLLITFLLSQTTQTFSALRFGADQTYNDIQIRYFQNEIKPEDSSYLVVINRNFDYFHNNTYFSFCFSLIKIITSDHTRNCSLDYEQPLYDCLTIYTSDNSVKNYSYWRMNLQYEVISNVSAYHFVAQNATNTLISLKGRVNHQPFSFLKEPNRIYKVLTTNYPYFQQPNTIRVNYLSTLALQLRVTSDNVLMQRQALCYYYKNITNLLFLGGIVRKTRDYYMISTIHYQKDHQPFIMWQGFAFSRDKASRDMVGVNMIMSTVEDLYSLYARAPFPDTSNNINATHDWNIFSKGSGGASQTIFSQAKWHYEIHMFRLYETQDVVGDEIIRFKIQNKYCYAASFLKNQTFDHHTISTFTYKNNTYSHQLLECFFPILDLQAIYPRILIFCFIFILALPS